MFPQLKSIFNNTINKNIPTLQIPTENQIHYQNSNINFNNCTKNNDNILLSKPSDKANALVQYLANVNNKTKKSNSPQLEEIINIKTNQFLSANFVNNKVTKTLVQFNNENRAS